MAFSCLNTQGQHFCWIAVSHMKRVSVRASVFVFSVSSWNTVPCSHQRQCASRTPDFLPLKVFLMANWESLHKVYLSFVRDSKWCARILGETAARTRKPWDSMLPCRWRENGSFKIAHYLQTCVCGEAVSTTVDSVVSLIGWIIYYVMDMSFNVQDRTYLFILTLNDFFMNIFYVHIFTLGGVGKVLTLRCL